MIKLVKWLIMEEEEKEYFDRIYKQAEKEIKKAEKE